MKLSIITVNLNNCEGLQKTIDSVVAQTFRDFEWIVIDGGSTDGSKELIEQYSDYFAYWVSEPDKGIYNAMNKGIKVAKGEYLQFLNSGDWLCNETALASSFAHEMDSDIVYGNMYILKNGILEEFRYPSVVTLHSLCNNSLGHCASFIKRELFQEELYNEKNKIVSDWEFFLKQALKNKQFKHINETISCFDLNGISSNDELREKECIEVMKTIIPDAILRDISQMDNMEEILKKTHIQKVLEYDNKSRLYHKIITASIMFIELIDHLAPKRQLK